MLAMEVRQQDEKGLVEPLSKAVHVRVFKMAESRAGQRGSQVAHAYYQPPGAGWPLARAGQSGQVTVHQPQRGQSGGKK
jgi:hypothetical protein